MEYYFKALFETPRIIHSLFECSEYDKSSGSEGIDDSNFFFLQQPIWGMTFETGVFKI
jgi:hypothetical protein